MLRRRPVITGLGIISAAGVGVAAVWASIRAGQSGLRPLSQFVSPRHGHPLVGEVREDVDALAGAVRGSRSDKLAWIAAREALVQAGAEVGKSTDSTRAGVMLGATVGGMRGTEQFLTALLRENRHRFGPLRFHECAGAADLCARQMGALGPVATLSTACSAGALAILAAAQLIEQGEADLMLAGAGDSLSRLTLNGFGSLLLLDASGCRPFDARRAGISLGEGAAMLVLEAEATARARGARVLARLSGGGASCDAFHATAPRPDGGGALAAMQRALACAGLPPEAVDFVSTHGTATPDNDAMEAQALRQLFGGSVPPFGSVKRFFGHTLAASGAIKAVLAVQSLREQAVPGTPGFEQVDPKIGLEPVREFRAQRVARILSNSFGFGGNNVALVFEEYPAPGPYPETPAPMEVNSTAVSRGLAIWGAGVVSAAGCSRAEVAAAFRAGGAACSEFAVPVISPTAKVKVYAAREPGGEFALDPARRRKLSRIQQMTLVAARQALGKTRETLGIAPEKIAVAIGTGLGSLNDTAAFVENMIVKDERVPRPALFTSSVHNALASQVAMEWQATGLNSTPVQREISFETALWQAMTELKSGRADLALAGAADELNQYQLAAGLRWGWWCEASSSSSPESHPRVEASANTAPPSPGNALAGEGSAVFALGRGGEASAGGPLAHVSAIRIARSAAWEAEAEAAWMVETLQRDGISASEVDLLLTGANGGNGWDAFYQAVAAAFSRRAGRTVGCAAYKHACGEHYSASAFGFLTAIGVVRGEIQLAGAPDAAVKTVVLLTLSPTGTKGMCCVRA